MARRTKWIHIALAGAFGGTAANWFRVGTQLVHGDGYPQISYFFGVAIFGFMGAALVMAFKENQMKKALFLGMSIPTMFQSATSDITEHVNTQVFLDSLIGRPAYASQRETLEELRLYFKPETPEFLVVFTNVSNMTDEGIEKRVEPTLVNGEYAELYVPEFARYFYLDIPHSSSRVSDVLAQHKISLLLPYDYEIEITEDPWRGFKRALGMRAISGYTVWIHSREREKQ